MSITFAASQFAERRGRRDVCSGAVRVARVLASALAFTIAAAALAGCGSSSSSSKSSKATAARAAPSIERTSFVTVPRRDGGHIGVEVVARYHQSPSGSRRRLAASAEVQLKDGSTLRAAPQPDAAMTTTGGGERSVPHHLILSRADSAKLRADMSRGDKPQLRARVTDVIAGSALATTSVTSPQIESPRQITARNEQQPGRTPRKLGETYGPPGSSNPCEGTGVAGCQNIQGWSWTANDFMASHTQGMGGCPSGLQYVEDGENNVAASIDTSDSHHFSGISLFNSITVTDWNTHGHPYHYTIYFGCYTPPGKTKSP